jgi:hypothetical protein
MISTHEIRRLYLESTHPTGFRQHQEVVLQFETSQLFDGEQIIDAKR